MGGMDSIPCHKGDRMCVVPVLGCVCTQSPGGTLCHLSVCAGSVCASVDI